MLLPRFRLACRGRDSTTAYLPVTAFIQDINDNPPVFQSPGGWEPGSQGAREPGSQGAPSCMVEAAPCTQGIT